MWAQSKNKLSCIDASFTRANNSHTSYESFSRLFFPLYSVKNSLSPKWTTCFDLDYELGALLRINVGVYDEVRKSSRNKPMGSAQFEVGEVLGTRGNTKAKKLRRGGTLFCRITTAPVATAGTLRLSLAGSGLKNVAGTFGKSDPFYEISAGINAAGGMTWQPVFRSEHVNNNLNPVWKPATLDIGRLCGGDLSKAMQITIWDWHKNGKHEIMGICETCVGALVEVAASNNAKLTLRKKTKDTGELFVKAANVDGVSGGQQTQQQAAAVPAAFTPMAPPAPNSSIGAFGGALDRPPPSMAATVTAMGAAAAMSNMSLSNSPAAYSSAPAGPYVPMAASAPLPPAMAPPVPRPSFVDYLTGGCEIEMCVAVDFTGSNGDPRKPGTLHYIHPDGQLNDYEKALTAVGAIIARYDSDQTFPAWGFGAKYGGAIQHCFQIGNAPELQGIQGVLEAYRATFRTGLTMSGPTVFSEVIALAAAQARSKQEAVARFGKQAYRILLILTDGAVSDIEVTKRAITAAADAPMSIVIVGIGSADFSSMHFLDNFQDNMGGARDICQFVEFSKHIHDKRSLTRETLDEIPDQLVDYFFSKGIKPLPPISGSQISLVASEADEADVDLTLDVGKDGEISLADYNGPVYDDSRYDTISAYAPSTAAPPAAHQPGAYVPQAQPPPQPYGSSGAQAPYQPHVPSHGAPPQGQYGAKPPQRYGAAPPPPYGAPPAAYGAQHQSQYPPVATATAVPTSIFHVQVPQGVAPGSQLQVQNPVTRQNMIVTIPPGVQPGQTFAVRY